MKAAVQPAEIHPSGLRKYLVDRPISYLSTSNKLIESSVEVRNTRAGVAN